MDTLLVAQIATRREVLAGGTTCAVVDEAFQADGGRTSVLVHLSGGVQVVNREVFYRHMTGRLGYGRALYYRRPVESILPPPGVVLDGSLQVEQAALEVMDSAATGDQDLLVDLGDGWATVPAARLFKQLADLYRHRESRARTLVENAVDVIVILDTSAQIRYVSRHVPGLPVIEVGSYAFANLTRDDAAEMSEVLQRLLSRPDLRLSGDFRIHDADGATRTFAYEAQNLLHDPAVQGILVHYRDVTDSRAMEETLRHSAMHDALTGLANRSLFFDRLRHSLDRFGGRRPPICVLYCDLDGFKQVNDSLGHQRGDELLQVVANRLKAALRQGDTLARFGGDEFVFLVEDCNQAQARSLAERLVTRMAEPFELGAETVGISISIGLAMADSGVDPTTLIKQADLAMYGAKFAGRNRVCQYDPASLDREERMRRLTGDLRKAVANEALHLVFQPIVGAGGNLAGVEALLRWQHPELGPIPPNEIIAIAEREGLIAALGRWVIDAACATLAHWAPSDSAPGWVAVNVSAEQLEPGFVEYVRSVLEHRRLRPEQLHVELTETAVAEGMPERLAVLERLRDAGVPISLDDFGTGYSSLSSLTHLPLDTIKIDRSFVTSLGAGPEPALVLQGIVDMAHVLGFRVVAEGIERPEELAQLQAIGCDMYQGFLLGHPQTEEALRQWGPAWRPKLAAQASA